MKMTKQDIKHNLYEISDDETMIDDYIDEHKDVGFDEIEIEKLYNHFSEYCVNLESGLGA